MDGTLQGGTSVAEGDEIPFTKMKVEPVSYGDIEVAKYAKSVTIESVAKYGADVAVEKTDDAFIVALQNKVLGDFYAFLNTGSLTMTESTWQRALAMAKATVLDKFAGMDKDVTEVVGFANILDAYDYLFDVGADILGGIGRGIVENKEQIEEWASNAISNMVTSLRDNAPAIIEGGLALLEALAGAVKENLPLILETGGEIVGEIVAGISTASPEVKAIIGTAILPHINKIIDVVGNIKDAIEKAVSFIAGEEGIGKIISTGSKLMGGITKLFGLITANPVLAVIAAIIAAIVLLWTKCEWFRDGVISAWNSIKEAWGDVKEFFGGIADNIAETWDNIKTTAVEKWDGIKTAVSEKWNNIRDTAKEKFEEVRGKISTAWDNMKSDASSKLSNLKTTIEEKFDSIVSGAKKWGKDLIDNFVSGIKSKIESVKNAVSNAASTVKSFLGFSEPEEGPLSNFHTYAPDMMKLFAQGITDNAGMLKSAFDKSLDFGIPSLDFPTNYAGVGYSVAGNAGVAPYGVQSPAASAQPIVINLTAQAVLNKQVIGETAYTYIHNRDRAYGGR